MNALHRFRLPRIFAVVLVVAMLAATPAGAVLAQDDPFNRNDFTSPKFGTEIEWTSDWRLDRSQSAIEQRRDILVLLARSSDAAIFIELHSQRSFRSAEVLLETFMERFTQAEGFEITDDQRDVYPPAVEFVSGATEDDTFGAYLQAQAIDGAMMVVAVLGAPDALDDAFDLAVEGVTVNGMELFDALAVCGAPADQTGAEEASPTEESDNDKTGGFGSSTSSETAATPEPATGGGNKPGGFGSDDDDATPTGGAGECVEIVVPTPSAEETPEPTPTPNSGRGGGLNNATYEAPTFPGVSLQYNKTVWEVADQGAADENNGRDFLQLDHLEVPASIVVETYAGHNGRASACIDLALREAGITPASDDLILDADGNPIQGSQQGRVWSAYAYDVEDTELGAYVECRALSGGAGVIVITLIAQIDPFLEAYEDLQPILGSVTTG